MIQFKEYLIEIEKTVGFTLHHSTTIAKNSKRLKPLPGGQGMFWLTQKMLGGKIVIIIYIDTGKDELVQGGFLELTSYYPTDYPIPVKVAKLIHVAPSSEVEVSPRVFMVSP